MSFFQMFRAANSAVSGGIPLKLKLIQAFMVVLITCKGEEDRDKNEGSRVLTMIPHYKPMGIFSNAQGQLTPQSFVKTGRNSILLEI